MDPVTGAVIIVGLQKVGGPAAEVVKGFLAKVLAPTSDALGSVLAHPIVEWQKRRVERANRLVEEAAAAVAGTGGEPQPVPVRLLMPILEKGSLEEDEELHQRWVNLLANAALEPSRILPSFVTILGELSPVEVNLLWHLYRLRVENPTLITPVELRNSINFKGRLGEMDTILTNLTRLALIKNPIAAQDDRFRLSRFGAEFVLACSREEPVPSS